jgi:BASS family bile acid:Na+ symporter
MEPIADLVVPAVTFVLMVVVGHSLTPADFRRSAMDLRAVMTATIGQLILLPLIATTIVLVLEPGAVTVAGLVLVAACPGGTISNFYSCLARANSALSVTLTVASCLLSFVTLPVLVAAGYTFWLDHQPEVQVPFAHLVVQLLALVALPICLGMALRRWRPQATDRRDLVLRRLSLAILIAVVVWVVRTQWTAIIGSLFELVIVALVFTTLSMTAGFGLAWITGRPMADRLTYLLEFACRNLALALVVAVTILHRPELVAFAAVLLLVQALMTLGLVAVLRHDPTPA